MKHLVIVNPAAGRGRGDSLLPRIRDLLQKHKFDFELVRSERPAQAIEIARRAAQAGIPAIITAGGDGTANEAINGIMQAQDGISGTTVLGMLCIGTGNDFAGSLGLPGKIEQSIEAIKKNIQRLVDIGRVTGGRHPEGRYFGNCVGIGFDAAGTIQSQKIRWAKGTLAYLISAVQTIFYYYKAPRLEIKLDHEKLELPALLVSIMNGKRIGGGFWTAPDSEPDDGIFDLCIAREVSRARMFTLIPHFLKGTQATQPEVQMKRSTTVWIKSLRGSMPVQTDGEIIAENCAELKVEILHKKLKVIGFDHA
ncbi:MAG: diacylglycerol kinase family lipid kinase [Anaerolineaceae bacterium]|nr:diacylglycerol kinase family lipid kinase [Anaerolineaceae bacterium]